jgi:hypothetical protein
MSALNQSAPAFLPAQSLGKAFQKRGACALPHQTNYVPVPHDGFLCSDGILEIDDARSRVTWSSPCGQFVRISLTPPSHAGPVLGAVWTSFERDGWCLCVLQPELVLIHSPDGPSREVTLPSKFDGIWPLEKGLLLQRALPMMPDHGAPTEDLWEHLSAKAGSSFTNEPNIFDSPSLFSLMHGLDEPKPMALPSGEFVGALNERVRFSLPEASLLVTFNPASSKCAVWMVKQVPSPGNVRGEEEGFPRHDTLAEKRRPIAVSRVLHPAYYLSESGRLSESNECEQNVVEASLEIDCIWVEAMEEVVHAFVLPDYSGLPMLYLQSIGRLDAYHLDRVDKNDSDGQKQDFTWASQSWSGMRHSFSLPCRSAVPLSCRYTRSDRALRTGFVLALPGNNDEDGLNGCYMNLYMGPTLACVCSATTLCEGEASALLPSGGKNRHGSHRRIVRLWGAVDDRVNVVLEDRSIYRIRIPFGIVDGLVAKCFANVVSALNPLLSLSLLTEIVLRGEDQWKAWSQVLTAVFVRYERASSGRTPVTAAKDEADPAPFDTSPPLVTGKSAWREMMESGFHAAYDHSNQAQLRCFAKGATPAGSKRRRPLQDRHVDSALKGIHTNSHDNGSFGGLTDRHDVPRLNFVADDFVPRVQQIFLALHMAYEDCKVSVLTWPDLDRLEPLLTRCASLLGLKRYEEYYARDAGPPQSVIESGGAFNYAMPSSYKEAIGSLEEMVVPHNPPDFWRWVTGIFRHGLGSSTEKCRGAKPFLALRSDSLLGKIARVYLALHRGGNNGNRLAMEEMVRSSVTLAELETLPVGLALPLQEAAAQCRDCPPEAWFPEAYDLVGRTDLIKFHEQLAQATARAETRQQPLQRDDAGLILLQNLSRLRFGRDRRLQEACRLLRSHKAVRLVVERGPEHSDHDLILAQQARLELFCRRVAALPVGRGMLTLSTVSPQLTGALPVPELIFAGRVPPANGTFVLDQAALHLPPAYAEWVRFHNGVAAGLRISPNGPTSTLTRTWILYNKPKREATYEHGGFLLALGLQGHLAKLKLTDVYAYLNQGHEAVTCALLLGLSITQRGRMDSKTSTMLCLHIPSLLPHTISENTTSEATVQVAAVLGIGFLYEGSSHRLMTEFLIKEIGRRPLNDRYADRESYSLAAGLALGLVALGCGSSIEKRHALADLRVEDRLHRYIVGGGSLKSGGIGDLGGSDGRSYYDSMPRDINEPENRSSRVLEGSRVNVNVTAPGAIIALGLMYLRSNNCDIAARVAIPDTHFLLDYVRPDLLMLREIARNLILWDSINASSNWVRSEVPAVVRDSMDILERQQEMAREDAVAASEMRIDFDVVGIKQAHANVVAGACFSLGLKYAGTADRQAHATLLSELKRFQVLRHEIGHRHRPDRSTLEMCLGCCALSLAMVMAGTGELSTLRILRSLRTVVEDEVRYGQHMAIGMAIGLLFLGGGRWTLGRSNEAVAALVCAFYPRFPMRTTDNQYHLQALRHVYTLAAEKRSIEVYDAETLEPCYAPLSIELTDGRVLEKWAPCLLPEKQFVKRVSTNSLRHWRVVLSGHLLQHTLETGGLVLQRRTGHLSYERDPLSFSSIFARRRSGDGGQNFCEFLSEDPTLLKYAEHVLGKDDLLYRCITTSGDGALVRNVMALSHTVRMLRFAKNSLGLQSLWMVLAYYDNCTGEKDEGGGIPRGFLESLREKGGGGESGRWGIVTGHVMQDKLSKYGINAEQAYAF